ncbi:hypothetical protein RF11_13436 [Thelohanellus kitauei]|uniref:Uncharacterized protein n=1 Tax=Thelohanellus kitauei TaxID=669202 RepID=A0A0C2MWY9_THEKT|nr:hypothetical protein RF11_13436 [Thelohanellus kitauei]
MLEMSPHYESSNRLPMYSNYFKSEKKISPSQIYLFSLSDKLTNPEQIVAAIPELSDVPIAKYKYENGNLFIFHVRDRSKFLKVLHLNGSSLNGTTDYTITFGDDITYLFVSHSINNISSNILVKPYNQNLQPVDNENNSDNDEIGSVKGLMCNPKNLMTFKQMMNKGVNGIVL